MSLNVENLTVNIGTLNLIKSVSLEVKSGKILAIIGPNGAGKSTLLKALVGEIPATSGDISINGCSLSDWHKRDLAKLRAVLPQKSTLSFAFTVEDVVLMGRTPHLQGIETKDDYAIVAEAMYMTGIDHLANRTYITLSGGEQQRVQLARVLAQIWSSDAPRYLLLDEPTNNLDLAHQHSILTLAQQFTKQNVGVLTVLHDLNLAAQYADDILVLKDGQTVAQGLPENVLTPPIIQSTFDLPVIVQEHPCYDCPLIIAMPQIKTAPYSIQFQKMKENIS